MPLEVEPILSQKPEFRNHQRSDGIPTVFTARIRQSAKRVEARVPGLQLQMSLQPKRANQSGSRGIHGRVCERKTRCRGKNSSNTHRKACACKNPKLIGLAPVESALKAKIKSDRLLTPTKTSASPGIHILSLRNSNRKRQGVRNTATKCTERY